MKTERVIRTGPRSHHLNFKPRGFPRTPSSSPEEGRSFVYGFSGAGPPRSTAASLEIIEAAGGMANVGAMVYRACPNARLGAMVAGNSGRPAGAIGLPNNVNHHKIHGFHRTQEEDIVST